jgi:hypothetical protein
MDTLKRSSIDQVLFAVEDGTLCVPCTPAEAEAKCVRRSSLPKLCLFDNTEVDRYTFKRGFGRKTSVKSVYLNAKQMEFVLFVQGLGDESVSGKVCTKTVPRDAERAMMLKGTPEGQSIFPGSPQMAPQASGQAYFKCTEWLDAQQLKAQMSKTRGKLVKQLANLEKKEAADPNVALLKVARKPLLLAHASNHNVTLPDQPKVDEIRALLTAYSSACILSGTPVVFYAAATEADGDDDEADMDNNADSDSDEDTSDDEGDDSGDDEEEDEEEESMEE